MRKQCIYMQWFTLKKIVIRNGFLLNLLCWPCWFLGAMELESTKLNR